MNNDSELVSSPNIINHSPRPEEVEAVNEVKTMTFPEAMQALIDGKRIRRLEWQDQNEYGMIKDGWLQIRVKGKISCWQVGDGDMLADDWIALPEKDEYKPEPERYRRDDSGDNSYRSRM